MLITIDNMGSLLEDTDLMEVEVNRAASEYISNHYEKLLAFARSKGLDYDRAYDAVDDMLLKLLADEKDGKGFNGNYGDGEITVEQFVFSRLALYTKNAKYRSDIVESAVDRIEVSEVVELPVLKKNGEVARDRKGNVKTERKVVKHKENYTVNVYAASYNGMDEEEGNDSFQKAYALAASWDEQTVDYDEIRENVETCIDICDLHNFNVLCILKNIDNMAKLISTGAKSSVFGKFIELVRDHDELSSAFTELMMCSKDHRAEYESIIACY
jgi:hypothetical protein